MNRDLDGIYFIVNHEPTCLSDMTTDVRAEKLAGNTEEYYLKVIDHLCYCLKRIGDEFDIARRYDETD